MSDAALCLLSSMSPAAKRKGNEIAILERVISQFPIFDGVDRRQRRKVCQTLMWQKLFKNDTLFEQDSEGSHMFLVLSGTIGLFVKGHKLRSSFPYQVGY